jgi:hypothetical protein
LPTLRRLIVPTRSLRSRWVGRRVPSITAVAFVCCAACSARAIAQATPVGGELQVNTYVTNRQERPSIAVDGGGRFLVSWQSNHSGSYGVFARRFNATGSPQAPEFQVNTATAGFAPAVANDRDGAFVVVWFDLSGVIARRFDSSDAPRGSEFQVDIYQTGSQYFPSVDMDGDGDFVIVWQTPLDGSGSGVSGRRIDAAGVPQATEFQVNTFTAGDQIQPDVALDSDGDFVVVWMSLAQDGSYGGIFAQRFDSAGMRQASEFQVNSYTMVSQGHPDVDLADDGDFVVAWQDHQDGSYYGVFGRRFNSGGAPQATEFQVNTQTASNQDSPTVAVDGDGDFVVVWRGGFYLDGDIFARRFDASGLPQGVELQVNSYTPNGQENPAVAVAAGGDFAVTWQSMGQEGSLTGVFAQRFKVPKTFDLDGNGATEALTDGLLFLRYTFGFHDATLISGAIAGNCTRCTAALIESYVSGIVGFTQVKPAGPELQVNSYTGDNQQSPAIAMDGGGNFAVAWNSPQDGSGTGIIARRFGQTGSPLGPEFQVNDYVTNTQYRATAAASASGDFVVSWTSYPAQDGSGSGIFGRRFGANGAPQGGEFQVNTRTENYQASSAVALDGNGNFVIAWQGSAQDGSNDGVFARRFNAAGVPQGVEFQVSTYTTGSQFSVKVASSAGGFVVAWVSAYQDGSDTGIFARRFNASGVPQAAEFQVNTFTTGHQLRPAVAMDANGNFVIAWHHGQLPSEDGISAQSFNALGVAQANEFQVSAGTTGYQRYAAVASGGDGFVVAWQSSQTGSYAVFARRLAADGTPQASEFQVNAYDTGDQVRPVVAADQKGDLVIAWHGPHDGSGDGIFAQRYLESRAADIDGDAAIGALTDGLLVLRYLFGFRGATLITGAVGAGCTRCTAPAIESYLAAKV